MPDTVAGIKSRLSPGDKVSFVHKGERISGVVQKLNPKRAIVLPPETEHENESGKIWDVPYRLLTLESPEMNYGAQEQAAAELARRLMNEHNLGEWRFQMDEATSRAAVCRYTSKIIGLSRLFIRHASEADLRDAILHEIAHALAGPRHNHDAVWRRVAQSIGCTGNRCYHKSFAPAPWLLKCPNGCFPPRKVKRRRHGAICRNCRSRVFYEPNRELM